MFEKPKGVDASTTDKQFDPEEARFLKAVDSYKALTGRKFPTYSEILKIAKDLGYRLGAGDEEVRHTVSFTFLPIHRASA